ncbi:MAG TPA: hypothetical protein VGM20_09590 [Gemmatimonadales bacterium]|jgi:hypothetical protein
MFRTPVRFATALAAVMLAGCGGSLPTAPSAPESQTTTTAPKPSENLTLSLPLPTLHLPGPLTSLGCALSGSISVDIGPNGGTVTLGATSLVIPKHALSQLTHIVALPSLIGKTITVQYFPEGLKFASDAPPTLTFNTDCLGNPANAQVVYTDDFGNILERLPTSRTSHTISAQIHHFSRYAVAW